MTTQNTTPNVESPHQTILILGGTGKTGSRVAKRLADRGLTARLASRSSAVRFDWDDSSTWPAALQGVAALYLTYYPDLASPRAAGQIRELAQLAAASGVHSPVVSSPACSRWNGRIAHSRPLSRSLHPPPAPKTFSQT